MPVSGISAKSEEIHPAFFNVIRNGVRAMKEKGIPETASRRNGEGKVCAIRFPVGSEN